MPFEPEKITKEHILSGVQRIERVKPKLNRSTVWDVVINGKNYPPKEVMKYAHQEMNGELIWYNGGGEPTNKWLQQFDFLIVNKAGDADPILELIEQYKKHVQVTRLKEELYKWRLVKTFSGRPDVNASDFGNEITSIKFSNLIYPAGISVIHHIAKERPEELREEFKNLFNEEIELSKRVNQFSSQTLKIYRDIAPTNTYSHHQDERTIGTYLAFFNSNKYAFYKDSFYQKYCKLIGIVPERKGYKLVHYLELLNEFIENYVKNDAELIEIRDALLTEDCYPDTDFKILAQDILYSTLDQQKGLERSYWRIGTTADSTTSYWNIMRESNHVAIGWSEIGDLSEKEVQNKNQIIALLEHEEFYQGDNRLISRKAGEILDFYNEIKEGDIVLAQDGATVLGICEVIGDYSYNPSLAFSHYKPVQWKLISPPLKNSEGLRTSVYRITALETIQKIEALLSDKKETQKMKHELNQVLFGPPGTGKTYNTINKALELCEINIDGLDRTDITRKFEELVDEGRIVFTTFHQSMTYEDFIEGIKPIEPEKEGDPVVYRVVDGIFKMLCTEASFSLVQEESTISTENVLDFSLAFDNFVQAIEEKLAAEETIELDTKNGGKVVVDGISQQGNLIIKHPGKNNTYPVSKQRLTKLNSAFPDLAVVTNIDHQFRSIIGGSNSTANWAVLNAIRNNNHVSTVINKEVRSYSWEDKVQVVKSIKKRDFFQKTGKPFVLIIDEINRGNVSQIFGELITLIEEDKRLGRPEAIQVKLPYSKDWFGVPPNVHIIGTMNTADRSVEALDTALRRRFSFSEMPPKPELIRTEGQVENGIINGLDLATLLDKINRRIEKLLDKDHMIGHSYFLSVKGLSDLKSAFQNKIIPLLQEYFFGDYGKIGLVLGAKFFEVRYEQMDKDFFAPFEDYDNDALIERKVYHLKNIFEMSEEQFLEALYEL